ncbi:hypothetical protein ABK040_006777 [Willaertia magna]
MSMKVKEKQLRSACEYDEYEKVKQLLEEGVDVNSFDERSGTPLIKACQWGSLKIVQLLVDEYNASINHKTVIGTPLHWAAYNGHLDVVKFLLSKGADKTIKNNDGLTAEEVSRNRGIKEEVWMFIRDN